MIEIILEIHIRLLLQTLRAYCQWSIRLSYILKSNFCSLRQGDINRTHSFTGLRTQKGNYLKEYKKPNTKTIAQAKGDILKAVFTLLLYLPLLYLSLLESIIYCQGQNIIKGKCKIMEDENILLLTVFPNIKEAYFCTFISVRGSFS